MIDGGIGHHLSVDNLPHSIAPLRTDGSMHGRQLDRADSDLSGAKGARAEPSQAQRAAPGPAENPRVLVGEREHRLYVLPTERIDYVESQGNYVKLHVGSTDYIARDSVKRLSMILRDSGFVRIQRALLINIRSVHYAQRLGRGYVFTLVSGQQLCSGVTYREAILQALPLAQAPGRRFARRD